MRQSETRKPVTHVIAAARCIRFGVRYEQTLKG